MTFEKLQTELVRAMKSKNKAHKDTIADIITYAKNMAIEKKCKDNISEEIITEAILKAKKTCQEQIDTCPSTRTDLLEAYTERMQYIDLYVPRMMTYDEIKTNVLYFMSCEGTELNKGGIMKVVMPRLKGKAEGKLINKVVEDILKGE